MTKRQRTSRRRGVGSITNYQTKAGTRWRFQLWVPVDPEYPDGPSRQVGKGGYETAEAADDAMQAARGKQRAGVDLSAAMPTVAEYSQRWLDGLDHQAATVAGYRRIFRLHITPTIGHLRLDKVSPSRLARLYTALGSPDPSRKSCPGGLSKNTVHKAHVCLSAMFEAAREDNLLALNPARKRKTVNAPTAKSIKRAQSEMVTWTGQQLRAPQTAAQSRCPHSRRSADTDRAARAKPRSHSHPHDAGCGETYSDQKRGDWCTEAYRAG